MDMELPEVVYRKYTEVHRNLLSIIGLISSEVKEQASLLIYR